jgi:hypothetical protein
MSVHEYQPQHGCDECAVCSMPAATHPPVYTEVPELQTTGPLLPEDHVDFWRTPCPVCKVSSGECVSASGYYMRPHAARLDRAVKAAS